LDSFANIDARQMNRNLAYLTGLYEAADEADDLSTMLQQTEASSPLGKGEYYTGKVPSLARILESMERNKWWLALIVPLIMSLLASLFLAALDGDTLAGNLGSVQNATSTPVLPLSAATIISSLTSTTSRSVPATTSTSVVYTNPNKAAKASSAQPSTSSLASALSYAGFLSEPSAVVTIEPEVKKTTCTAHIHSANEILVTIPSGRKASWLAKGAIDINVYRGQEPIKTKLSVVDEGLVLEVGQKDAYGSLNVSVITTRRPKIDETFTVDFGKPMLVEVFEAGLHLLQDLAKTVSTTADEAVHLVGDTCAPAAAKVVEQAVGVGKAAQGHCEDVVNRVKDSPNDVARFIKDAKTQLSRRVRAAQKIRTEVDHSILRAQIASKLLWLKLRGKTEEHDEYQRNAKILLKTKYRDMIEAQEQEEVALAGEPCGFFKKPGCWRSKPGNGKTARQRSNARKEKRDGGWKMKLKR